MTFARQVLNALLPRGAAWAVKYDGGYDRLLDGISDCFEQLRALGAALGNLRHPMTTQQLEDLEREFGVVTETGLSVARRREYLQSIVYASVGLGSASDLEARLRAAGFDVRVYQNNPVMDPADLLASAPVAWCGNPDSTCGYALATCSTSDGGSGRLLLNETVNRTGVLTCDTNGSNLAAWQAVTGAAVGEFGCLINGVLFEWFGFDFGSIAAIDEIPEIINAQTIPCGLRCRYDAAVNSFIFEATVDDQTVSYLYTPGIPVGTDISGVTGNLFLNGDGPPASIFLPYAPMVPEDPKIWPFIFFIGGSRTGWEFFVDWNMEHYDAGAWDALGNAALSKNQTTYYTDGGIRSLAVHSDGTALDGQMVQPDNTDPDLISFYRMHAVGGLCENVALPNLLVDGNAEKTTGIGAFTAGAGTIISKHAPGHSGEWLWRASGGTPAATWATQNSILAGHTYTLAGWMRGVNAGVYSAGRCEIKGPDGTLWLGAALTGGASDTAWQEVDITFTSVAGGSLEFGTSDTIRKAVEFDEMLLKDLGILSGHSATESNTINRQTPLIRGLEFDAATSDIACEFSTAYNGDFSALPAGDGWTAGSGWTVNQPAGSADRVPDANKTKLEQSGDDTVFGAIVQGQLYRVTYTVTDLGGAGLVNVAPYIGNVIGTTRLAAGTYSELIRANMLNTWGFGAGAAGAQFEISAVTLEAIDEAFAWENLTISAVVKMDDPTVLTYQGIATNRDAVAAGTEQYLCLFQNKIRFGCVVGGVAREISTVTALDSDTWYDVYATRSYDGTDTTLSLYLGTLDGDVALEMTVTWAGAPDVTEYDHPAIGVQAAGEIFDGLIVDHVAFYGAEKDVNWVEAEHRKIITALVDGPGAGQALPVPVTDARTLRAFAWSLYDADGYPGGYPVIAVKDSTGVWTIPWIGVDSSDTENRQDVSVSLPDGIVEARLLNKKNRFGDVYYDNIRIDDITIATAQVPAAMRDKFERLILATKPLHSWAGLIVDYV